MIGLYTPGESVVHQAAPGWKLLGLLILSLALVTVPTLKAIAGIGLGILMLWRIAGLPLSSLAADVRPVLWFGAAILLFHALAGQFDSGIQAVARFAILIIAAMLVTRTTPVTAMLAALERVAYPLRFVGVRPARLAFLVVLIIRLVPVIAQIVQDVRQATAARGCKGTLRSVVLPTVSRTLLFAGQLGEALDARGYADDGR